MALWPSKLYPVCIRITRSVRDQCFVSVISFESFDKIIVMLWLKDYFEKVAHYPTLRFILELTLLAFVLKFAFIFLFGIIFFLLGLSTETSLEFEESILENTPLAIVSILTLFAAFETLIGQWFVIWLTSKLTANTNIQIFSSALVFSALHIEPFLIVIVFPIGIVLAWTFVLKRKKSLWEAFWVTTAIHVLHNLAATGLLWVSVK